MPAPMKKKTPALEVIMGVGVPKKPGGKGGIDEPMPGGGDDPDEDMGVPPPSAESEDGAFDTAYEEAHDETLSPEERKAAFKRAVMACMGGDY